MTGWKHLLGALAALTLAGGTAVADSTNPAEMAIGIDIDIAVTELDLRVNDVPVFDPATGFGGEDQIVTKIPLNPAFAPGPNTIDLRLKMAATSDMGFTPGLTIDFATWRMADFPFPFDGHPMATHTVIGPVAAGDGSVSLVADSTSPGQPLLQASDLTLVDGPAVPGEWSTWRMEVDVGLDLPPLAWRQGAQTLEPSQSLANELAQQYAGLQTAIAAGPDAAIRAMGPFFTRQAAAIGTDVDTFLSASFLPLYDPDSGWSPVALDLSQSRLQLFGGGRLAALVPIPLGFENANGDRATLFVYFWKDRSGNWQVIH